MSAALNVTPPTPGVDLNSPRAVERVPLAHMNTVVFWASMPPKINKCAIIKDSLGWPSGWQTTRIRIKVRYGAVPSRMLVCACCAVPVQDALGLFVVLGASMRSRLDGSESLSQNTKSPMMIPRTTSRVAPNVSRMQPDKPLFVVMLASVGPDVTGRPTPVGGTECSLRRSRCRSSPRDRRRSGPGWSCRTGGGRGPARRASRPVPPQAAGRRGAGRGRCGSSAGRKVLGRPDGWRFGRPGGGPGGLDWSSADRKVAPRLIVRKLFGQS